MAFLPQSRRARFLTIMVVLGLVGLWYPTAYPRGMLMAFIDHACGHYEIQTYGYPVAWYREYSSLLREKYDVQLNMVAGCVVWPTLEWYVDGYNSVSESLLKDKYGQDIFRECSDLAREKYLDTVRSRQR